MTPFYIIGSSVIIYFVVAWAFVFRFDSDITGVAWAIFIAAVFESAAFILALEKKIKKLLFNKTFFISQLKIILCSFLMAVFLYLPFKIFDELIFDTSRTVELIGLTVTTSTIGILVYFFFSVLFGVKELSYFSQMLSKFGKWRKPLAASEEVLIDSGGDGEEI